MLRNLRLGTNALRKCALPLFGTLLISCDHGEVAGPPDDPAVHVQSATGIVTSVPGQRTLLARIARTVALALGQAALRESVYAELHRSPYRENKLHFRPFLVGAGQELLAGMVTAGGLGATEQDVLAALDSAIDLEMYMPVPEHWTQWTGEPVLVATALRDHEIPIAYDIQGSPVILQSAEIPPSLPTIALVPAETDFSTLPANFAEPSPALSSEAVSCPPSACMTFSYLPGDWEGFMMGEPEFETYVFVKHPSASSSYQYRCVGAQGSPYYYDQNSSFWYGSVELVSGSSLAAFKEDSSRLVMFVWEDDADDCTIKKDKDWFTAAYNSVITYLGFGSLITAIGDPDNCEWECVVFIANLAVAPFDVFASLHEDDFVGELVPTVVAGSCSGGNHRIVGPNQSYRGCVQISGIAIEAPPPPPPPPLTASVDGPSVITQKGTYTWTAERSGGSGGYTYQWHIEYLNRNETQTLGTAQTQSLTIYSGDGEFEMSVKVTSGGTNNVVATLRVQECIASACEPAPL